MSNGLKTVGRDCHAGDYTTHIMQKDIKTKKVKIYQVNGYICGFKFFNGLPFFDIGETFSSYKVTEVEIHDGEKIIGVSYKLYEG